QIGVSSEVGRGTTFSIYLPIAATQAAAAAPSSAPAPVAAPGTSGRRVLLVEDEAIVRRIAERALARRGWHVTSAESGEAALSVLAAMARPPDVLVSDIDLPGISGIEAVRAIRDRTGNPALPVLLVSGYATAASARLDGCGGRIRLLAKPFHPDELTTALAELAASEEPALAGR
ncbi:MAG: response regulator, partial [Acetobacteraceae bacterium]|nr:response regulator [Acetobacteraceae bacterium]